MFSTQNGRIVRDRLEKFGALLAIVLISMLVIITFIDVIGRQIGYPLSFAFEFTQMTVGLMFYVGLPLVTLRGEHIVVDVIPLRENGRAAALTNVFVNFLSAGIMAIATIQLWQQGATLSGYNTVLMFTRLPVAPFVYIMSVLAGVTVFILLALAILSTSRALSTHEKAQ